MTRKIRDGGGARAPWMPFYGRDFYSDVHVRAMTWEQRGVYQFLLWTAWDEGAIPGDTKKLARICDMTARQFAKVWSEIGERWIDHPTRGGWLINRRQERVREESGDLSRRMRALAEKRWGVEAQARTDAGQHLPTDAEECEPHAETDATPHAAPQCESASDPPCDVAMLNHKSQPQVTATGDGRMDGGSSYQDPERGTVRDRVPRDAGDIARSIVHRGQP